MTREFFTPEQKRWIAPSIHFASDPMLRMNSPCLAARFPMRYASTKSHARAYADEPGELVFLEELVVSIRFIRMSKLRFNPLLSNRT
jgi:hypothetical protein